MFFEINKKYPIQYPAFLNLMAIHIYTPQFILSSVDGHLCCFQILAIINYSCDEHSCINLCENICIHFSWKIHLGAKLLDHRADAFLPVLETAKQFSKAAVSFYIPITSV